MAAAKETNPLKEEMIPGERSKRTSTVNVKLTHLGHENEEIEV